MALSLPSDGYVDEIPYTFGYQPEIAPARMAFALLLAGYDAPVVRTACELGFGQGVSLAVHAAVTDVRWYGNDLLATHCANLRALIAQSGACVDVSDEPFARYCKSADLPQFDYIALHGVWSWVSSENRAHIVRFLHERLAPGGVVYVGYNVLPGWRDMLPLRTLLMARVQRLRDSGMTLAQSIETACRDAARIDDPQFEIAVRFLRGKSTAYLAHELFNRDWQPMPFGEIASALAAAGLEFVAEAKCTDAFDRLNFTAPQRAALEGLAPIAREDLKDALLARKFRRDYFCKAGGNRSTARRLSPHERAARLRAQRVRLARCVSMVNDDLVVGAGAQRLDAALVRRLRDTLASGNALPIAELTGDRSDFEVVLECVVALVGRGDLALDAPPTRTAAASALVNDRLLRLSREHHELSELASWAAGSAIDVGALTMRFLDLWLDGVRDAAALAEGVRVSGALRWAGDSDEAIRAAAEKFLKNDLIELQRAVAFERVNATALDDQNTAKAVVSSAERSPSAK